MDITIIITAVISAIIGASGVLLNFRLGSRKQNVDEFRLLLDEYKVIHIADITTIDKLTKTIERLENRIDLLEQDKTIFVRLELALREEITTLRKQNKVLVIQNEELRELLNKAS